MRRTGPAAAGAMLLAAVALAGCGREPAARPSSPVTAKPAAAAATVDAAEQQRVKNGCMEQLEAQAANASPQPGVLHPQSAQLIHVAFLGDIKPVRLASDAPGYELGIEFRYKLGHDDPRTGRKLCRINLADSSVDWQSMP